MKVTKAVIPTTGLRHAAKSFVGDEPFIIALNDDIVYNKVLIIK